MRRRKSKALETKAERKNSSRRPKMTAAERKAHRERMERERRIRLADTLYPEIEHELQERARVTRNDLVLVTRAFDQVGVATRYQHVCDAIGQLIQDRQLVPLDGGRSFCLPGQEKRVEEIDDLVEIHLDHIEHLMRLQLKRHGDVTVMDVVHDWGDIDPHLSQDVKRQIAVKAFQRFRSRKMKLLQPAAKFYHFVAGEGLSNG